MKKSCLLIPIIILLLAGTASADTLQMPDKNLTFYHRTWVHNMPMGEQYFRLTIPRNISVTNITANITGYTVNALAYAGEEYDINNNPWDIASDENYFYTVDSRGKKVFRYFKNWSYADFSFNTTYVDLLNRSYAYRPGGITTDGTYLWVTEPSINRVHKYSMDGTHIGYFTTFIRIGCVGPRGITHDDDYFWVAGMSKDIVCKYTFPDGVFTGENFSMIAPSSITINGSYLWVTGFFHNYIFKYHKNGTYTGLGYDATENDWLTGIIAYSDYFWTVDRIRNKTYANEWKDIYPAGISIDTTNNSVYNVIYDGELNNSEKINLNATALRNHIYYNKCRYNLTCNVPFRVISNRSGGILIKNITIEYEPDEDGDGIPDSLDNCSGTPLGAFVHVDGCMVETTEEINTSGGTISNEAGTTSITIPSGALNESTNISINATTNTSGYGVKEGTELQGYIYEFNPSPLEFNQPVTVVMTYEDQGGLGEQEELDMYDISFYNETTQEWEDQNASQNITIDTLTMNITHFSTFGIFKQIRNKTSPSPSPRWTKRDVIEKLDSVRGKGVKDKDVDKIIKHIEKSLNEELWRDEWRLSSKDLEKQDNKTKNGKKVFDEEKKAVKELIKQLNKKGKKELPEETKKLFEDAIDKLVKADETLATIAIQDAKDTEVKNPDKQEKVDKELEKAEKEMNKAYEELSKNKQDKAIDHFKKAWEHANHAIKHAQKE